MSERGTGREKQMCKTFLRSFLESAPCPGRSHVVLRRMLLRIGRAQVDEDGRLWGYVLLMKSAEVRALCWEGSASVPHWVQTAEPMSWAHSVGCPHSLQLELDIRRRTVRCALPSLPFNLQLNNKISILIFLLIDHLHQLIYPAL
jgi:hypothetical protein